MGIPCTNIKNYIKSVQTEFKTQKTDIFVQGYPKKRTEKRKLWKKQKINMDMEEYQQKTKTKQTNKIVT